jgi:hypothetical protein
LEILFPIWMVRLIHDRVADATMIRRLLMEGEWAT